MSYTYGVSLVYEGLAVGDVRSVYGDGVIGAGSGSCQFRAPGVGVRQFVLD